MRPLRELMTSNPVTISRETSIPETARLMKEHDVGVLPVTEGENLVGIVTDRDIVVRAVAENALDTQAGQIMSMDVATLSPDDDDERAERIMAEHGIRRLPVCDGSKLIGIVSVGDLAVRSDDRLAGEVMEETGPKNR